MEDLGGVFVPRVWLGSGKRSGCMTLLVIPLFVVLMRLVVMVTAGW